MDVYINVRFGLIPQSARLSLKLKRTLLIHFYLFCRAYDYLYTLMDSYYLPIFRHSTQVKRYEISCGNIWLFEGDEVFRLHWYLSFLAVLVEDIAALRQL